MFYISHRGNLAGPKSCKENHPDSVLSVLRLGYDCEIDVWLTGNQYHLGHDFPEYTIEESFLYQNGLWIHCKNIESLVSLKDKTNCFYIDRDDYVLTSRNIIWASPNTRINNKCVLVQNIIADMPKEILGICSDYIQYYYEENQ